MAETKAEKFHRLAEKRVPKAGDAIRLVGQLSSANYESTSDEATAIVAYRQMIPATDRLRPKVRTH